MNFSRLAPAALILSLALPTYANTAPVFLDNYDTVRSQNSYFIEEFTINNERYLINTNNSEFNDYIKIFKNTSGDTQEFTFFQRINPQRENNLSGILSKVEFFSIGNEHFLAAILAANSNESKILIYRWQEQEDTQGFTFFDEFSNDSFGNDNLKAFHINDETYLALYAATGTTTSVIEIYKFQDNKFMMHQAINLPKYFGDLGSGPMAFFTADESNFMLLPSNGENAEGLLYEWISDKFQLSNTIPNMRFVTDVEVIEHQGDLLAITAGNVGGIPCTSDNYLFKWENKTFTSVMQLPSCGYALNTAQQKVTSIYL